ncbi:Bug family tripartite tricarboxylate transporter substrate binding protein [Rhodoplanes azumiensis]|uniref:Bug family tripartite tricarboxylate transporter substrate binding protein n=1 Tax=Rhodoplanes azumiensis TaxID=1897628 RepID=A0ABW5AQ21_9BRAD
MFRNALAACAALAALAVSGPATTGPAMAGPNGDAYPARTITVVVPVPAGGSVDGVARILAHKLQESLGVSVIVENRAGGAGGTVGAGSVVKSAPDGYTLLLHASLHVGAPFLFKNVPYDVTKDFTPITLVASGPLIVSTAPNVPANTLKEFFDLVRKEPSKYTFATSGFGAAGHLAVELLKHEANVDALVIAYRGATPMLADLMSGQIQLVADPMVASLPLVQAGKIKALAITSLERSKAAPDIPTVAESGMKPLDFGSWYGLWAPKGLPPEITAKLQEVSAKVLADEDTKRRFAVLGFEPIGSSTEAFKTFIADETARTEKIIKDAMIKSQ